MTTLEKIWGKLFEDGKPTKRLGQFLRGIALHLIEDYPPGNTLVVTPEKMQRFYRETAVPGDNYPWHDIFDDRTSSISRLFRGVQAEHHLVQLDNLKERPDVPGLTPKGFERWATIMIQCHPDREYERLQKAVLHMPISNPDDRKERFPKEIPRRLFPDVADLQLRQETGDYIIEHCGVNLPRITDEERAQAQHAKKPDTSSSASNGTANIPASNGTSPLERTHSYERGRPRATVSTSAIIDDEEDVVSSTPIERERKPYSANPGLGKVYDEGNGPRSSTTSFSTSRPEPSGSGHRAQEKYDRGRESLYGRSGSGATSSRRFSRGSRSSSRSVKNRAGDYRHSASELLERDHAPRYSSDFYSESPVSLTTDADDSRRHRGSAVYRNSRDGEEYYRGMAGGQGGGPVDYKYYH
ncbi:hypothetical protein N7468_007213 [Penicillium chermesinum]|uniref:DUF7514 domain-containing protein n=1 Tax=Penicillium chermesinum TaxID=63820 RepID=A0A9W9NU15_9EURO|nr:uncharacterized protein N7468_007213 [Penicillium chermesinum]KAJ5225988.1 hypothetical protein N7468_007213 [Penicillium chermesinum]